jgi:1D-myo-inositol-tetrakisphosphate 5-kinase/inositol-polyphosphate multikinase
MPPAHQPTRAHTLDMQVGGHKGVQQSGEGDLIMKPCLPAERDFYQAIASDARLAALRGLVPQFYGTLRLEGKVEVDAAGQVDVGADKLREVLAKNSAVDEGKDEL